MARELMREVKAYGGILPSNQEEVKLLPSQYKSADGIPIDELAQELGMTESELTEKIHNYNMVIKNANDELTKGNRKRRKYSYKDFMAEAEYETEKMMNEFYMSGISPKGNIENIKGWDEFKNAIEKKYNQKIKYDYNDAGYTHLALQDGTIIRVYEDYVGGRGKTIKYVKGKGNILQPSTGYTKYSEWIVSKPQGSESKSKIIPEEKGQMTLFGLKDLDQKQLERVRKYVLDHESLYNFTNQWLASPDMKIKKARDWYKSQIFDIKNNMPVTSEKRKYAVGYITFLQDQIDSLPEELETMTFKELWNIVNAKDFTPFQAKEQLTLFGIKNVFPYWAKDGNEVYFIDEEPIKNPKSKQYYHQVYDRDKKGKLVKINMKITPEDFANNYLPGTAKAGHYMPMQMTLFGKLKNYFLEDTQKQAVKWLKKHPQYESIYIVPTAYGYKLDLRKPSFGTPFAIATSSGGLSQYDYRGSLLQGLAGKKIYGDDFFSPKQQELFPHMRRELTLELDDPATSNDPLEACLERKGWDLRRVQKIQDSIADKMTPDMFGKKQKLSASEIMLQEQIDNCFQMIRR
jgi:hypothetical protein